MASHSNMTPAPHECTHEQRLTKIEAKQDEHAAALMDGRVKFAEIQRDLAQIQLTLAEIKSQLANKTSDWVVAARDSAINWITLAVLGGIFWSIIKSGSTGIHP